MVPSNFTCFVAPSCRATCDSEELFLQNRNSFSLSSHFYARISERRGSLHPHPSLAGSLRLASLLPCPDIGVRCDELVRHQGDKQAWVDLIDASQHAASTAFLQPPNGKWSSCKSQRRERVAFLELIASNFPRLGAWTIPH